MTKEIVCLKQIERENESVELPRTLSSVSVGVRLQSLIGDNTQTTLVMFNLDNKNRVINYSTVFVGDLVSSLASPREIIQRALLSNAKKIIIAHNHPSNDGNMSESDLEFTKRLVECCNLFNIEMLDHFLVGSDRYYSYAENYLSIGASDIDFQNNY
ncbi:JAB domain-containing protein [Enterococcus alishanensis]